jgi:hypothetical protein
MRRLVVMTAVVAVGLWLAAAQPPAYAGVPDSPPATVSLRFMTLNIFYGGDELDLRPMVHSIGRRLAPRRRCSLTS